MSLNHFDPPVVFVSYTWESLKHADRVLELSDRLRADGIDVILDQYLDTAPDSWPQWGQEQIQKADYVLMVCTKNYYRHIMGKEQSNTDQSITNESDLIFKPLGNLRIRSNKFLPVLFNYSDSEYIPDHTAKRMYYPAHTEQGYEALYRCLTDGKGVINSNAGALPQLEPKSRKQNFFA